MSRAVFVGRASIYIMPSLIRRWYAIRIYLLDVVNISFLSWPWTAYKAGSQAQTLKICFFNVTQIIIRSK